MRLRPGLCVADVCGPIGALDQQGVGRKQGLDLAEALGGRAQSKEAWGQRPPEAGLIAVTVKLDAKALEWWSVLWAITPFSSS